MKKNIKKIKVQDVSENALSLEQMKDIIASSDAIVEKLRNFTIAEGTYDASSEMRLSVLSLFTTEVLLHYANKTLNEVHKEIRKEIISEVNEAAEKATDTKEIKKLVKKYGSTSRKNKSVSNG